jgi:glycosidase
MLVALLLAGTQAFRLDDTVVYEANLRALGPKGGFAALTTRLDAIQKLGANVLWLMPVQPVGKLRSAGGLGSPYATADYDSLNPEFGTESEFRALIASAHRHKLAIIIDWVANHTAWDNPWVKEHPDWYTHDAKGQITIPAGTNWQDVADLNYDMPALRVAMIKSMCGWVKRYGIDGFRCDTADWVPFDFWKDAVTKIRGSSSKPLLMLAEGYRPDQYTAGFDLTYGWHFYDRLVAIFKGQKASTLKIAASEEAQGIPAGARRLRFTTNHDKDAWEGTPLDFYKTPVGVRGAFVIASLYGGTPLIYTGQEVGWSQRIPIFDRSTVDWSAQAETGRWMASLMRVRREHPSLNRGDLRDLSSDDIVAFRKHLGADESLVAVNVRGHRSSLTLPKELKGGWHDAASGASVTVQGEISLEAYESRILVRR